MQKQKSSTSTKAKKSEVKTCPQCSCEIIESKYYKCSCNYMICLDCYEDIKKKENYCPKCNQDYSSKSYNPSESKKSSNTENIDKKKGPVKQKSSGQVQGNKSTTDQSKVRVIKKNLVYVIGLAPEIASEVTLQKLEYFGQYGKITKCVVNKLNAYNPNGPNGPSYSAYITYQTEKEASFAILAVDDFTLQGRTIRASYGTTKYCQYFLKDQQCPNIAECLYLHEYGKEIETFLKDDIQSNKLVFKDSQQLAIQNIKKLINELIKQKIKKDKTNCPSVLPHPSEIIKKLVSQSIYKQSEIDELMKSQENSLKTESKGKAPNQISQTTTHQKTAAPKKTQIIDQWSKDSTIVTNQTINILESSKNQTGDSTNPKSQAKKGTGNAKSSQRMSDTNSEETENNTKIVNQKPESRRSENMHGSHAGKQSGENYKRVDRNTSKASQPQSKGTMRSEKDKAYSKGQKKESDLENNYSAEEEEDAQLEEEKKGSKQNNEGKNSKRQSENNQHDDSNLEHNMEEDMQEEQKQGEDNQSNEEGDTERDPLEKGRTSNSNSGERKTNKSRGTHKNSSDNGKNADTEVQGGHSDASAKNLNQSSGQQQNTQNDKARLEASGETNSTFDTKIVNSLLSGIQRNHFFSQRFPNQISAPSSEKAENVVVDTIATIMKEN